MDDRETERMRTNGGRQAAAAYSARPAWIKDELIALTLKVWQPYYPLPLTENDAVEMLHRVGRLFTVLRTVAARVQPGKDDSYSSSSAAESNRRRKQKE